MLTISDGHLIYPKDPLLNVARIIDSKFIEFHGQTNLSKESYIFEKVFEKVKREARQHGIPVEVIKCLIRTRTYIRLREMNKKKEDKEGSIDENVEKCRKRLASDFSENDKEYRQKEKKILKFVN